MLDENCLERRCVAWDLIGQNLEMPIAEKLSECFLKIWAQRPRGSQVEPVFPATNVWTASMAWRKVYDTAPGYCLPVDEAYSIG